jgi:hypothetical protein
MRNMKKTAVTVLLTAVVLGGCKDDAQQAKNNAPPATQPGTPAGAGTKDGQKDGDHPNAVVLGTQTAGGLQLKATQDEPIKAGGEGAFDLLITGGPKPKAVRFWVGVENGEGSAKAKADEETADNWHTHVEVPNPLPPGSKFWAEVEPQTGQKFKVSFDLKQ